MANIYDLIQQNAELPTNFINSYNAGVQMKRQEEDRQLQRKQLIQQIEGLIQDNRKRKAEATLKEEELGPEATEARKKGRLAETVKAEADIKYTDTDRLLEQAKARAAAAADSSRARYNSIQATIAQQGWDPVLHKQMEQAKLESEQALAKQRLADALYTASGQKGQGKTPEATTISARVQDMVNQAVNQDLQSTVVSMVGEENIDGDVFSIQGFSELENVVREKLSNLPSEQVTPQNIQKIIRKQDWTIFTVCV